MFYPFVMIASVWGGTFAGLSKLILGALAADFLWLAPIGSFRLDYDGRITLTAFTVACLCVIFMARLFRSLVELRTSMARNARSTARA